MGIVMRYARMHIYKYKYMLYHIIGLVYRKPLFHNKKHWFRLNILLQTNPLIIEFIYIYIHIYIYISDHIKPNQIILYHVISYHIISYHVTSYYIISSHIISYHTHIYIYAIYIYIYTLYIYIHHI